MPGFPVTPFFTVHHCKAWSQSWGTLKMCTPSYYPHSSDPSFLSWWLMKINRLYIPCGRSPAAIYLHKPPRGKWKVTRTGEITRGAHLQGASRLGASFTRLNCGEWCDGETRHPGCHLTTPATNIIMATIFSKLIPTNPSHCSEEGYGNGVFD